MEKSSQKVYGLSFPTRKTKEDSKSLIQSVFADDSEDESEDEVANKSPEHLSLTKSDIEKALEVDPSVFQYDEIYDDIRGEKDRQVEAALQGSTVRQEKLSELSGLVARRDEEERREKVMDIKGQDGLGGFYRYMYQHGLEDRSKKGVKTEEKPENDDNQPRRQTSPQRDELKSSDNKRNNPRVDRNEQRVMDHPRDTHSSRRHDRSDDITDRRDDRSGGVTDRRHDRSGDVTDKRHDRSVDLTERRQDRSGEVTERRQDRSGEVTDKRHDRSGDVTDRRHDRSNGATDRHHYRSIGVNDRHHSEKRSDSHASSSNEPERTGSSSRIRQPSPPSRRHTSPNRTETKEQPTIASTDSSMPKASTETDRDPNFFYARPRVTTDEQIEEARQRYLARKAAGIHAVIANSDSD